MLDGKFLLAKYIDRKEFTELKRSLSLFNLLDK